MQAWMIWVMVAAGLGVAELVATTLDLALLGIAALSAAGLAALGLPVGIQFLGFCISAVLLMALVRPVVRRHMVNTPPVRSGVARLVGKEAVTLTDVARNSGRVRIGGEEWTARPYDSDLVIPKDTTVEIFAIDGATALVYPREEPLLREDLWQP
ncbi:NfeD family protein [Microlunatus sp. Gsoil 973]|jgi:membrane protein implicated in regulation of membrane protease activity|uniref:NfeD family protein n=1 Tax=Microlunatus sp. Gsoil 973 TaxID=2672569 RepID=UPI0012B4A068|nr:NfeD family protein [Microlunatus sp. Gsoil 973]QGN32927.1 NfeD family protein [Microlunatus sp. Gsoil 973]